MDGGGYTQCGQNIENSVQESSTSSSCMSGPASTNIFSQSLAFFSVQTIYSGLLSNIDFSPPFIQLEVSELPDSCLDAEADAVAEADTDTEERGSAAAVATAAAIAFAIPLLNGTCDDPPAVILRSRVQG